MRNPASRRGRSVPDDVTGSSLVRQSARSADPSVPGARAENAAPPQFLTGLVLTLAVALAFPFDTGRSLLPGGFATSVEWLIAACLAAAAIGGLRGLVSAGRSARFPAARGGLWRSALPALAVLAALAASAAVAPSYGEAASSFTLRFAAGLLLMFAVGPVVATPSTARLLLWAMVGGAGLASAAAIGEWAGWPIARALLSPWRSAPWEYVGVVRAAGTLPYPTIAAAFFGVAAPLALALGATEPPNCGRWRRCLPTGIAALCAAATVVTLTRGAILALVATLVGLAILSLRLPAARPYRRPALAVLAALILALAGVLGGAEVTRTRFLNEHNLSWYGAEYTAPVALAVPAGEPASVDVTVTNRSKLTWTTAGQYPFVLGYRWLSADGSLMLRAPVEVPLPRDVAPGETVTVPVPFAADLPPGRYRLDVGMLHHRVSWFRHAGVADAGVGVAVEASRHGAAFPDPYVLAVDSDDRPDSPPAASRTELWRTALALWRDHPWLGVGPDSFRFVWSAYLGRPSEGAWFHGLFHAHNLPLELLADTGLLGTLAFAWFLAGRLGGLWRRCRGAGAGAVLAVGLLGAVVAYLLHSQFDCFWAEPSVSTLVWLCLGLAASPGLRAAVAVPAEAGDPGEPGAGENAQTCPPARLDRPAAGREERLAPAA